MTLTKLLGLISIVPMICSCAWTGAISEDFHTPSIVAEKIDAKVGILDNKKNSPHNLKYGMSVDYSLDLKNSKFALQKELSTFFKEVVIVPNTSACKDCNLFVNHKLVLRFHQREAVYAGGLKVDFLSDKMEGLRTYVAKTSGDLVEPGNGAALGAMSGLTLGLTAGASISIYGNWLKETSESIINDLIDDVGEQIYQSFNKKKDDSNAIGSQISSSEQLSPTKLEVDSQYKQFLSAVGRVYCNIPNGQKKGSGFFISPSGLFVTNAHVIQGCVSSPVIELNNKWRIPAEIVLYKPEKDLALLKISDKSPSHLKMNTSSNLRLGEKVIAVGAPLSLGWSVTEGVISASRVIGNVRMLQTDVTINHGSSGGALICLKTGKVVGVTSAGAVDNQGNTASGLNYAISYEEVNALLKDYFKQHPDER